MNGTQKTNERIITGADIDSIVERLPKESADNAKRQLRKPLLNALDIYDKNVSKGRITESAEEKATVDKWYKELVEFLPGNAAARRECEEL